MLNLKNYSIKKLNELKKKLYEQRIEVNREIYNRSPELYKEEIIKLLDSGDKYQIRKEYKQLSTGEVVFHRYLIELN